VWVPTQDGEASFAATLAASGLPADKCEVHMLDLGGGFGRRGAFQDYVHQAVNIAKQMPGTPIKLLWSREEDMAQGRFHPVMMAKMTGAFDKDNNLTGLHIRLSGQSILASVRPQVVEQEKGRDPLTFQGLFQTGEHSFSYTIPNLLIDHAMRNPHVPPGFWRGVNINQNAISWNASWMSWRKRRARTSSNSAASCSATIRAISPRSTRSRRRSAGASPRRPESSVDSRT